MTVSATFTLPSGSSGAAASSSEETELTKITDHAAQAVDRLPEQHKSKVNFPKLIEILTKPAQELEDVLWDLLVKRRIDTATGVALTTIGKIVGQEREGISDDDVFRRYVRARITANKSSGRLEDLLSILTLTVYDDNATLEIERQFPAAMVARVNDVALTSDDVTAVNALLQRAKAAGVRLIFEYAESVDGLFTFDDATNTWDVGTWYTAV